MWRHVMNRLNDNGCSARADFGDVDGILVGRIFGTREIVDIRANSVREPEAVFRDAADAYVDTCTGIGSPPGRPVPAVSCSTIAWSSPCRGNGRRTVRSEPRQTGREDHEGSSRVAYLSETPAPLAPRFRQILHRCPIGTQTPTI